MKRLLLAIMGLGAVGALANSPVVPPEWGMTDVGVTYYNQGLGVQLSAHAFNGVEGNHVLVRTPTACGLQTVMALYNSWGQQLQAIPAGRAYNLGGYTYFTVNTTNGNAASAQLTITASAFVPGYSNCGVRVFVTSFIPPAPPDPIVVPQPYPYPYPNPYPPVYPAAAPASGGKKPGLFRRQ